MAIEVGSEVEGKVTGITKFGAFVELPKGKTGMIHISQIAEGYITDITKHLNVGDIVKVKVLSISKEDKYNLSIKQVGKANWQPARKIVIEQKERPQPGTFEDKITRFLKESEEKLADWKRNLDNKHGIRTKKYKT